jgi:hypothetical protein
MTILEWMFMLKAEVKFRNLSACRSVMLSLSRVTLPKLGMSR